jgi:hypothetical protein
MNVKFSTIAAGIATTVIIASMGIIGVIGQQQMASATLEIPQLDELDEDVRELLIARGGDVIEREICPGQIAVRIPPSQGGGFVCLPLPDISVD